MTSAHLSCPRGPFARGHDRPGFVVSPLEPHRVEAGVDVRHGARHVLGIQ